MHKICSVIIFTISKVVKYLKYKYLKYVFEILGKYFVFCILAKSEMYFVFKYKKILYLSIYKIHVNCQIQSTTKKST